MKLKNNAYLKISLSTISRSRKKMKKMNKVIENKGMKRIARKIRKKTAWNQSQNYATFKTKKYNFKTDKSKRSGAGLPTNPPVVIPTPPPPMNLDPSLPRVTIRMNISVEEAGSTADAPIVVSDNGSTVILSTCPQQHIDTLKTSLAHDWLMELISIAYALRRKGAL